MSANNFDVHLDELLNRSVGRLLQADSFDPEAFNKLQDYLWQKAEGLQAEHCISKQILRSIRSAASVIRSRAESLPAVQAYASMANEFEMMLDRLIVSETREARAPGRPRIV